MSDPAAPVHLVLDNTMGALFIGVVFAMALWGAGCVQVYYYFNRYLKEDWRLKLLVFVVWALDTTHQGLITHTAYTYLVTEYGNPLFLNEIVVTLLIEVVISALIVLLVQSFLVLRVWKLSRGNIPLVVILCLLVAAEFSLSIVYTIKSLRLKTFTALASIVNLSRSVNIFGAAGDIAIAMALVYLLHRARTGFHRSDGIINRLIMFSLNTGILTSLDAVMSLVTITVLPNSFVYILFFVTVSRLYTNSLLATLNSRKTLQGGLGDESTASASVSNGARFRSHAVEVDPPTISKVQPRTLSIKVNTETETVRDIEEGIVKNGTPSESDTEVYEYGDRKPGAYPMHAL
ncbi:hypothetical protein EW145_g3535 [Phellinidium pouzarii]|uniref:DUF6534 domain-containing protein n=1 Tax=Phellinidium pouzarii TaxID=167371 RepID=A0A4S4L710_9AGAM|nr:hypothetical protein EW145_g3535 [Phellinidium pouzarii]